jgi:hypothetical protein
VVQPPSTKSLLNEPFDNPLAPGGVPSWPAENRRTSALPQRLPAVAFAPTEPVPLVGRAPAYRCEYLEVR